MDKPRIAFLCGAGTSVEAGMPKTMEITNEILSEDGIAKSDFSSLIDDTPTQNKVLKSETFDHIVLDYLNKLQRFADGYSLSYNTQKAGDKSIHYKKHSVNYEDIYYMLIQTSEYLSDLFNPYGQILYEKTDYQNFYDKWEKDVALGEDYRRTDSSFINYTGKYMVQTVIRMLTKECSNKNALRSIAQAFEDPKYQMNTIFTLNHDVVLEKFMAENNIGIIDGFGDIDGELRKWAPTSFDVNDPDKIRLLKLHGSIDRIHIHRKDRKSWVDGIYVGNNDVDEVNFEAIDSNGNVYDAPFYPHILIGTNNKIHEYVSYAFRELFFRFIHYLEETDCLVVCGCSFGDSPINHQIHEWMLHDEHRKMIVTIQ